MMMRSKFFCLACMMVAFTSCTTLEFDKTYWKVVDDVGRPVYREKMLKDLTQKHQLIGLKYTDLVRLLGEPDSGYDTLVRYSIVVDYGWDIDPVYTKDLFLSISADSVVKSFKIEKWSDRGNLSSRLVILRISYLLLRDLTLNRA